MFGKHLEERLRTGSKYLELSIFLEKFGLFKTAQPEPEPEPEPERYGVTCAWMLWVMKVLG